MQSALQRGARRSRRRSCRARRARAYRVANAAARRTERARDASQGLFHLVETRKTPDGGHRLRRGAPPGVPIPPDQLGSERAPGWERTFQAAPWTKPRTTRPRAPRGRDRLRTRAERRIRAVAAPSSAHAENARPCCPSTTRTKKKKKKTRGCADALVRAERGDANRDGGSPNARVTRRRLRAAARQRFRRRRRVETRRVAPPGDGARGLAMTFSPARTRGRAARRSAWPKAGVSRTRAEAETDARDIMPRGRIPRCSATPREAQPPRWRRSSRRWERARRAAGALRGEPREGSEGSSSRRGGDRPHASRARAGDGETEDARRLAAALGAVRDAVSLRAEASSPEHPSSREKRFSALPESSETNPKSNPRLSPGGTGGRLTTRAGTRWDSFAAWWPRLLRCR